MGSKITLSSALGHGTNNLGEVWAIGLGLDCATSIIAASAAAVISHIHIFSDSEYAIGVCSKGWFSKDYHPFTSYIRTLTNLSTIPITYHKVAAHVGIPLNDEADAAAKKGALASKTLTAPRELKDLLTAFRSSKFAAYRF